MVLKLRVTQKYLDMEIRLITFIAFFCLNILNLINMIYFQPMISLHALTAHGF
jgi:hypothetical protein